MTPWSRVYGDPGPKLRQEEEKWEGRNSHVVYILLHESDST